MDIVIKNAKVHNLRGIDVTIPRNSLTVITGLSGSGKSSLAFDTLYAEGQRRYVESLSAYARQFLDRMEKPDVERIDGLSPAISIEQHTTSGNPRSIVATVTEIHDYLRILYGSIATAHCPHCGKPVTKQSAEQIVDSILNLKPQASASGRKIILLAPVVKGKKGAQIDVFTALKRNGFARVRVDGEMYLLDEVPELDKKKAHNIDVVIDRLVLPCAELSDSCSTSQIPNSFRTRLTDSVELALKTGKGILKVEELGSAPEPRTTNHEPRTTNLAFLRLQGVLHQSFGDSRDVRLHCNRVRQQRISLLGAEVHGGEVHGGYADEGGGGAGGVRDDALASSVRVRGDHGGRGGDGPFREAVSAFPSRFPDHGAAPGRPVSRDRRVLVLGDYDDRDERALRRLPRLLRGEYPRVAVRRDGSAVSFHFGRDLYAFRVFLRRTFRRADGLAFR